MQKKLFNVISKSRFFSISAAVLILTTGTLLGMFISFAAGIEHRTESKPIKVD